MIEPRDLGITYTDSTSIGLAFQNWYWPTPTPALHGLTFIAGALNISAPSDTHFGTGLYCADGPSNGMQVCNWDMPAGQTSAAGIKSADFPAGTTLFQFHTQAVGSWNSGQTLNQSVYIDWTSAAPPPSCVYGTEPAPTAPLVSLITSAVVDAACAAIGAPWLAVLFDPLIGYALDTGKLCGTGPAPVGTITPQNLLEDIESKLQVLESVLWYSVCECKPAPPAMPPPVVYPTPVIVIPIGWPARPTYTCSNSDICTTLELILKRLDELSTSQSIQVNQTTTIIEQAPPRLRYQDGAVHAGLTGSASIDIEGLVGVRVECTQLPNGLVLPGNPPYLWDVGWMSVNDGGAMLMERRIARTSAEWVPPEMELATSFGYYLNAGVEATMTELVPA